MNCAAFVQARLGSSRLPRKVLAPLAGKASLVRIVERVQSVPSIDTVVVVVPDGPADEPLRAFCEVEGLQFHVGSELDVLDRFHSALARWPVGVVVRITGDCPLVDPEIVERVIDLRRETRADHAAVATGALPPAPGLRRFPDGLDAEVIAAEALVTAWKESTDPFEREHVTPFIWRRPDRFTLARLEADQDLGGERWTVDHPEDLAFVAAVYDRFAPAGVFGYEDVLELLDREPDLRRINESCAT